MKQKFSSKLLGIILIVSSYMPVWSQISEGGLPPSFVYSESGALKNSIERYETSIDFDVNQLLAEDEELVALGFPPHCAKIIPVTLDIANSGTWSTLPDGQLIWRLEIVAENALAIMLYYDQFVIPEGGKLYIYNADRSKILGAYTQMTNSKKAEFATEFVGGDKITLEYVSPLTSDENPIVPQLKISGIAYGYNYLRGPAGNLSLKSRWDSEACMININCPEGDDWQDQKRGVARILTPVGGGYVSLCSGTIVNNTVHDYDPLFLSAHHCFEDMTVSQMNQTVYYFNYEWPGCEKLNTDPSCPTLVGAQMLADTGFAGGSDGALLRLNNAIPESYNVYFNGWDRRNTPATRGVGIHHPAGDVKKISTFTTTATSTTWTGQGGSGASNAHWNITFSATVSGHSVTEGGSSGSPLFNQNGLVVGTLTGGNSSCDYLSGVNIYGKLWYHWDKGTQKMDQYLDPIGSGEEFIEGEYVGSRRVNANFTVESGSLYVSRKINLTNASKNGTTWDWVFEGASPESFTGEIPPAIVYSTPGVYPVTLIVDKGLETEVSRTQNLTVVYKEYICNDTVEIGTGTTTSQFPLGSSTRQTFSSSIYTASELGQENGGVIKQISWYAGAASGRSRTVSVYLKEVDGSTQTASTWTNEINGGILVYESPNSWTNQAGWVTINLQTPYRYSGQKNLKVMVRILTTANSNLVNSNCRYSSAANRHQQWTATNTSIPSTNGTVNASRPNIRLNIDAPCGVYAPVADFNVEGFDADIIEIEVGDTISLVDRSLGPVVNWEWTLEGANPASSEEESLRAIYPVVGTYPISLVVYNHLGTDVKEKTVVVKLKSPIAGFSSSSDGFTTFPEWGQLLPYSGGSVTFTDRSKENPTERFWTLEGVEPSSSNQSSFTVVYPPGENTYSVGLSVENSAGVSQSVEEQYIQVGGTASVWNIPYGDSGDTYYEITSGNYLTGCNSSYSMVAEKFENQFYGSIDHIDLMIKVMAGDVTNRSYTVAIFSEQEGKPASTALASVKLSGTSINPEGYTTVVFEKSVDVPNTFFIVVSGLGTNANKIAIASSKESKGTVYVYANTQWKQLSEQFNQKYISLNIVPHFTYTLAVEFTTSTVISKKNIDAKADTVEFITDSNDWSFISTDNWINVEKEESETPSLLISCETNEYNWRSGYITIVSGNKRGRINVQQAGTGPDNLQVQVMEFDENPEILLTWRLNIFQNPGDYIYYRVYRNNELVGDHVEETEFVDTSFPSNKVVYYRVSAVYNGDENLESTLSNEVYIFTPYVGITVLGTTSTLEVYPNPVKDYLTINSSYIIEKVIVQDIQGRQIEILSGLNRKNIKIETSSWVNGVYIVRIQTENGSYNYKVVTSNE